MTQLPPPCGFHYDGDFFPMTPAIAKALMDVETTTRMYVSTVWAFAQAAGDMNASQDLFEFAVAKRDAEQKRNEANEKLLDEIRKQFGLTP